MIEQLKRMDYHRIPKVYAKGFNDIPWQDDWYDIPQFNEASTWVYKVNNQIVAFLISFISQNKPYISVLTVVSNHQGKGIGRKLLEHALDYWKDYESIDIHVEHHRQTAYHLYEELGFKVIETRKDDYHMRRTIER